MILGLRPDGTVNLIIFPDGGVAYQREAVPFSEQALPAGPAWTWPPRVEAAAEEGESLGGLVEGAEDAAS